mmetsp:Transcript_7765/g.18005  ORF Transcript_7765/g.18005 Transcript_7765/m.18005 type:complete len:662 (+) Transcript_7765:34-2019(+)
MLVERCDAEVASTSDGFSKPALSSSKVCQEYAATKMAAWYRGQKVREKVDKLRICVLRVQRIWRRRRRRPERSGSCEESSPAATVSEQRLARLMMKYVDLREQQAEAAFRIQRWFKSSQIQVKSEAQEDLEIQMLLVEHTFLMDAKVNAAGKIQRLFRKYQEQKVVTEPSDTKTAAALRIQRLFRLHSQLREAEHLEETEFQRECLEQCDQCDGIIDDRVANIMRAMVRRWKAKSEKNHSAAVSIQRFFRRRRQALPAVPSCRRSSCHFSHTLPPAETFTQTVPSAETTPALGESDSECVYSSDGDSQRAATAIQSMYRRYLHRRSMPMSSAVLRVQAEMRARQERDRYLKLRRSVLKLQQSLRQYNQWGKPSLAIPSFVTVPCDGDWVDTAYSFSPSLRSRGSGKIYLLPVSLSPRVRPEVAEEADVNLLSVFATLFFFRRVEVMPPLSLDARDITTRNMAGTGRQCHATDLLRLLPSVAPPDSLGLMAITSEDLFPRFDASHTTGLASASARVGACSWARFDPEFYGLARGADHRPSLFRRSAMLLAHEVCHLMGLHHCLRDTACLMSASSCLREADQRALHLCGSCLLALHCSIGFNLPRRCLELALFFDSIGFHAEAAALQKMLPSLQEPLPLPGTDSNQGHNNALSDCNFVKAAPS